MPATDDQLMLRVRDGDLGELGVLFERHHVSLFNFFLRQRGDRAASEDLVQEVFLRMLKYRHTYRGESQFACWMYQIARNARADHYRKWKHEVPMDDDLEEPASGEPMPVETVERGEEAALLRAALARLPVEKREVLVLSRFQHLKYEEIATLLGCKVGTVKVRVHRAIKELRAVYFQMARERTP